MSVSPPRPAPPADDPEAGPDGLVVGAGLNFTDPNSPLAPYYLRASHLFAAGLLAVLFVLLNSVSLWHTDVWGHLSFGRWVVEHGRLPDREPFSPYSDPEAPALRYCWLSQAGAYLLFHAGELLAGGDAVQRLAGGVEMVRAGHALLVLLRFVVLWAAFRRRSGSLPLAGAALAVAVALSFGGLAIQRPQVVGEFFFALLLLALARPVLTRRAVVLAPLVLVLWANAHGSYPAGLMLLGACAAGRTLEVLRSGGVRRLKADVALRRLVLVLGLSAAAVAVCNPAGPAIYTETLRMARHPNVLAMDEWQPLRCDGSGAQWAFLATLVLLAGTQALSRRWFSPTALVVILAFAGPPLLSRRLLHWWVMVAPWVMVAYWATLHRGLAGRLRRCRSVPSFRKTLVAGLLALVALLWCVPVQWLLAGRPGPLERTVTGATAWRLTRQLHDGAATGPAGLPPLAEALARGYPGGRFTGTVFASETLGDFLVWDLPPRVPVFIYTHVHLFPAKHWQLCAAIRSAVPGWRAALDAYRVNLAVLEPEFNERLCAELRRDPAWLVVLDEAGLRAKRDPRTRLFVALRRQPR